MSKRVPLRWPDVVNNIVLRLISTGQLPIILALLVVGLMVFRTPPDHIDDAWRILRTLIARRSGLGYGLATVSSGGWIIHTRYQRRRFEKEHERMADARNEAQQAHFKKKLKSSRP
jgi:hypothetical protein